MDMFAAKRKKTESQLNAVTHLVNIFTCYLEPLRNVTSMIEITLYLHSHATPHEENTCSLKNISLRKHAHAIYRDF